MKKLINQAIHFIGISGIGWLLDFGVFNLLNFWSSRVDINNMISSLVGVCFVFTVSTRKTFIQKENGIPLKFKFIIYVLYQLALITLISFVLAKVNVFILAFISNTAFAAFSPLMSKIIITPITMLCNFIVMKLLIERI
ncbi:MAG: hypothetical protein Q4E94_05265 [Clostridia bacterium]|nr:hypothetical protein [Clostridia bacterium]